MAKKKKNEEISIEELMLRNDDTDPTGGKKKRNKRRLYKPYSEMTLWDKVKGCAFWLIGIFILLVAIIPPKDKVTTTPKASNPDLAFVGNIPTNTPRSNITPIIRETVTAEALASIVALQTQNAPTQTAIVEVQYIVVTATPGQVDNPTETGVPTDVPLPTATAMTSNVAVIMVTNTAIPSATNTETPTATPTQEGVRQLTDEGVVTGESVKVRSCASTECNQVGLMNRGVTFPITGSVVDGQNVSGNSLWYQIEYEGEVGYVSATLVGLVSAQNVSSPVNQSISPMQPTQPIVAPVSGWNCSGNLYNCPSFGSGGQFTCPQLFEYMSACPNDPSELDRDQDGRFCETQCG